jgi:hypothetical protein
MHKRKEEERERERERVAKVKTFRRVEFGQPFSVETSERKAIFNKPSF